MRTSKLLSMILVMALSSLGLNAQVMLDSTGNTNYGTLPKALTDSIDWSQYTSEVTSTGDTIFRFVPKIQEGAPPARAARSSTSASLAVAAQSYMMGDMNLSHIPVDNKPATDKLVGEIPIQYALGSMGNVTYNVPIEVPQGRNGLQPNVSLAYNSLAGNGYVGQGWNIGGLSMIAVTGRNFYYNNATAAPTRYPFKPTTTDLGFFTLDGMRLLQTSGTTFDTEQGYTKVEASLVNGIVAYFTVKLPNGYKGTYGYASNTVSKLFYPLTKMEDPLGNYIAYEYSEADNQYMPTKISYGANAKQTHFASVEFAYSSRSDANSFYMDGLKLSSSRLLSSIIVKSGTSALRTYTCTYNTSNGVPLMSKIDCSLTGGKSLNPLQLYYGENNPSTSLNQYTTLLSRFFGSSAKDLALSKAKFDVKSSSDALISYPILSTYGLLATKTTGSLWWKNTYYQYGSTYHPDQLLFVYTDLSYGVSSPLELKAESGFQLLTATDYTGDGNDRLLKVNYYPINSSTSRVVLQGYKVGSTCVRERYFNIDVSGAIDDGGLLSPVNRTFLVGDFRGEGRMTLLTISYANPGSLLTLIDVDKGVMLEERSFTTLQPNESLFPIDYDGDGKTDVAICSPSGTSIYTWTDYSSQSRSWTLLASFSVNIMDTQRKFLLADVNGDGKTDVLQSPSRSFYAGYYSKTGNHIGSCNGCCYNENNRITTTPSFIVYGCSGTGYGYCQVEHKYIEYYPDYGTSWTAYLSKGVGGFEGTSMPIVRYDDRFKYLMQDMDNDGLSDMVVQENGTVKIYLNKNGRISSTPEPQTASVNSSSYLIAGNMLQDYKMSQLFCINGSSLVPLVYTRDNGRQRLLTGVVNSMGVTSMHRYKNITSNDYSLYQPGEASTFPHMTFWGSLNLASNRQVFRKGANIENESYQYQRGIIHRQGLGFRGFSSTSTVDHKRERTYTQTYDPLNFGIPVKATSPTSETVFTHSVSVASNKKVTIRRTKEISADKLNNNTATTSYEYDAYGNPTLVTADHGNGLKTVVKQIYFNQTDTPYVLGQPYVTTTTQFRGGYSWTTNIENKYLTNTLPNTTTHYMGAYKVQKVERTYDASGNLTSERTTPYNTSEVLETSYTYDAQQRYLLTSKDALGRATTYAGYNALGLPSTVTDFKSQTSTYTYDELGRTIKAVQPDGVTATSTYSWNISGDKLYTLTTTATGSPRQTSHYDALNRELQGSITGFDGKEIYTDKVYDSYGRLKKVSEPYTGSASRWTVDSCDVYDRVKQTTLPVGKTIKYTYLPNTLITEDVDRTTTTTYDATGAVVKVNDLAGDITYTLRPDGQPSVITAPDSSKTEFTYDAYGRRTKVVDPSAGAVSYEYDAMGNIAKQTDAAGRITTTSSDKYGRPTKVEVINSSTDKMTTTYAYNTEGQVSSVSGGGKTTTFTYDALLRPTVVTEKETSGTTLTRTYTYGTRSDTDDMAGKVKTVAYSGMAGTVPPALSYAYTSNGYMQNIKAGTAIVYTTNTKNHLNQTTQYTLGNGVQVLRGFDANGMPTELKTTLNGTNLQHFTYAIDATRGTLTWRKDSKRNLTENFGYDNQYRLTTIGGKATVAYNAMGSITSKSDAGVLKYADKNRPYAVTNLTGNSGTVPAREQNITYNGMQRPTSISENNTVATLTYGYDYQRCRMELTQGGTLKYTRYYLADCYEKEVAGSTTKERLYFGGTAYNAKMVYSRTNTGAWALEYLHRDHLGSITAVTDATGKLLAEYSYDAWGRQRDPANQLAYAPDLAPELRHGRGYTSHEHLPQFGLINMNARLYDPVLGRFLSPDPFVQAPDWSQSFNRYSYCVNNPLVYVDENGEFVHIIIGAAVGGIINLGIKAYQGKINGWGDGFAAFGIGAAAGAVGAATGGLAFAAAGGAAGGIGGFLAGASGGMVGAAASMPIQNVGNSIYFGDPFMTSKQYLVGIGIGGLVGGSINGGIALGNGRAFWNGNLPAPTPSPTPILPSIPNNKTEIQLPNNGQSQLAKMPEENSFTLKTTSIETPNYSIEGQSVKIVMQRPDITGYDASLVGKMDLYHNFPTMLDKTIVQHGAWAQRIKDAAFWFEAPGTINGTQGVYTIGVNQHGIIFHRCFYPN